MEHIKREQCPLHMVFAKSNAFKRSIQCLNANNLATFIDGLHSLITYKELFLSQWILKTVVRDELNSAAKQGARRERESHVVKAMFLLSLFCLAQTKHLE